jgi:hypothetical protein
MLLLYRGLACVFSGLQLRSSRLGAAVYTQSVIFSSLLAVRLEFPKRLSLNHALVYGAAMFCVQQIEHTSVAYSLLFFGFVMLSVFAFNVAGGFSKVIGSYVFWFALLSTVIGVTTKALLGQAADANLETPLLGMTCYTCSMAMLLVVVYAINIFDLRPYSIAAMLHAGNLNFTRVGLGCLVSAFALQFLDTVAPAGPGSVLAALNQLNVFFPLAMLFGTIGAIKDSNGRHSVNFVSGFSLGAALTVGTLAFSKQGMLSPIVSWTVAAAYMRFRLRKIHIFFLIAFAVFALRIANPLSSLRDDVPDGATQGDRAAILFHAVTHWGEVEQQQAYVREFSLEHSNGASYFNNADVGLLSRLTIIPVDDLMFTYTGKGHYVGYTTILRDYENWIPHFILPNKVGGYNGNYYAHEMGSFLAADDTTTGISFSPVAEAFHVGGWMGIFLLLPAIWFVLFASIDFVAGDMRMSPWALLLVVYFAHAGAESLLSGLIYYTGYGNLSMVVAIVFCTRMAPILGALFHGGTKEAPVPRLRMLVPPRAAG